MDETTTGREAAMAALAGTAVQRLFVGGPLHGEVRTMAPEQMNAAVEDRAREVDVTTMSSSSRVMLPTPYHYRAMRFAQRGVGWRWVMVGQDVDDPDRALREALVRRWLAEAPDGAV